MRTPVERVHSACPPFFGARRSLRCLIVLALGAVAATGCDFTGRRSSVNARFDVFLPPTSTIGGFQLSPDGRRLVVAAKNHLFVRSLDSMHFERLPDTEGARLPFWSPDSRSIGYFTADTLRRVTPGGPSQVIAPAVEGRGGSWNGDNVVIFAAGGTAPGVFKVPSNGGAVTPVPTLSTDDGRPAFPEFLPDGRHFFFAHEESRTGLDGVFVGSLDGSEPLRLLAAPSAVRLTEGHLLFREGGALMAQRFDVERRTLSADPVLVAADLDDMDTGQAAFSSSASGSLVFRAGSRKAGASIAWVDRTGRTLESIGRPGRILSARVSPDGQRLAFVTGEGDAGELWVQNLPSGPVTHAGRGPVSGRIAWHPASDRLAVVLPGSPATLAIRRAAAPFTDAEVPATGTSLQPNDWSADGKWLAYEQDGGSKRGDVWLLPLLAQDLPTPFAYSTAHECDAAFSANGRWVAYVASQAGRSDVFVKSAPVPGTLYRVAPAGGVAPRWGPGGAELFYQGPDDMLMSVRITATTSFEAGEVRALFDLGANRFQQVDADGRRFLVIVQPGGGSPLTLIRNWIPDGR